MNIVTLIWHDLPNTFEQLIAWLIVGVIFRGVFSKWLGVQMTKRFFAPLFRWLQRKLIKTERDVAIFIHYRNRALNKGHDSHNPVLCKEGRCIIL